MDEDGCKLDDERAKHFVKCHAGQIGKALTNPFRHFGLPYSRISRPARNKSLDHQTLAESFAASVVIPEVAFALS